MVILVAVLRTKLLCYKLATAYSDDFGLCSNLNGDYFKRYQVASSSRIFWFARSRFNSKSPSFL